MSMRTTRLAWLLLIAACTGRIDDGEPVPPGTEPPGMVPPTAIPPPPAACGMAPGAAPWRPVPLAREQFINSASDLLGFDVRPFAAFSDLGGRKITPGVSLSALQVEERMITAEAIAAAAALPANLARLCDTAKVGETACAAQLVDTLGTRAFRRPLSKEASAALRQLFDAGKAGNGTFATGVEYLVAGILQSPDFLYQLAPRASAQPGTLAAL